MGLIYSKNQWQQLEKALHRTVKQEEGKDPEDDQAEGVARWQSKEGENHLEQDSIRPTTKAGIEAWLQPAGMDNA